MEQLDYGAAAEAAGRHAELHFGGVGVDAPQTSDMFYRLVLEKCFYVGGMGAACQAEDISAAEYKARSLFSCPKQDLNAFWLSGSAQPEGSEVA